MKTSKSRSHEYHSMKEYEKKFFPETFKRQRSEEDGPMRFGLKLAKASLSKTKQMLQK